MSNAFYHYKQRCDDLERALSAMTAERDHYFQQAEYYRCEFLDATEKRSIDDPLLVQMGKALDGLNEVTMDEAIAAMGLHEPSRALKVRAGICLRELGWSRYEIRDAAARFVYRRNNSDAATATHNVDVTGAKPASSAERPR